MDKLFCSGSIKTGEKSHMIAEEVSKEPLKESELLLQKFYGHVKERGDDIYLTQPIAGQETPSTYTFKQVYDEAIKMCDHINSLNFEKHSKIAIVSKNCAHFIMAELAIWMSGNTTVSLFPNLNAKTCEYIFEHSEAKMLFVGKVEDSWNAMKKGVPKGIATIGFPLAPACDPPAAEDDYQTWDSITGKATTTTAEYPTRDFDDESLIVYTSGSTGTPKGVLHTFRTITMPTKLMVTLQSITKDDRYLSYLPIAHVMDRWLAMCCSVYSGMKVFFAESLATFVTDLQRARPTLFVSVPRLWTKFQLGVYKNMPEKKFNMLMSIPILNGIVAKKVVTKLGLDSVRLAGSGSAPIPGELLEWYNSIGLNLLEGYGMSENFCYSHTTIEGKARVGYIGNPFPGVTCKIEEGSGEILVKSPGTMVGYYKAPEKTAEVITEDGFLRTGDKGEIDSEGRLKITGRIKELFKTSKGKYVAPVPIENIINNNSHIELSLVGGSGQVNTMAVVQLAEGLLAEANKDEALKTKITDDLTKLLSEVNEKIEDFEKVGFIVIAKNEWTIEKEMLTPTMKIKRSAIEESYESKLEEWYSSKTKIIWE